MLGGAELEPGWAGFEEGMALKPCPALSSSLLPPFSVGMGPCGPIRSLRTRSAVGTNRVTSALGLMICGFAEIVAAPDWPAAPGTLVMLARFSMVWVGALTGLGTVPGGGGMCRDGRMEREREGGAKMEGSPEEEGTAEEFGGFWRGTMLGGALRTLGFRGGGNMERGGAILGGPARGGGGGIPTEITQEGYNQKTKHHFVQFYPSTCTLTISTTYLVVQVEEAWAEALLEVDLEEDLVVGQGVVLEAGQEGDQGATSEA